MVGKIVRCSQGHLYKENFSAGRTLFSVHFGPSKRFEKCKIDGKWGMVTAVDPSTLSEEQIAQAEAAA